MEPSLFRFIWKYSKRQQIFLLLVTLALFPFLYLTLELPKRIINDAIGAKSDTVEVLGFTFTQTTLLAILCAAFLLSVLMHGLLKMRINTMKGVLAERLLRRFRYQLVTRLFRFPKPFFQRTSQAEIVSMVTAESEPLGGMMGDAISQPILQAGQMLTILAFLFLQSFWFGLAAIALIPLQAWLIPKLQRRINVLNKARIKEVRRLAAEIGETAAGSTDLRTSGGHSFRAAIITHRLGRLFFIRLDIYRKKFFMKFLNNFITQLTPFFFFSIGGYLVIRGNVSLGALVAALAAYKDLSSPWKELLAYYNMSHEMSQRWRLITEHFAPKGMLDEALIEPREEAAEKLTGDIVFEGVSVRDSDGLPVVEDLNLNIPGGSTVGIAARREEDRRAVTELLTRELLPSDGKITIGGQDTARLHQAVIGHRIGCAETAPYLFEGTIGDNILLPLKARARSNREFAEARLEAERTGNSLHLIEDDWIDPGVAGFDTMDEVEDWWLGLMRGLHADRELIRQGLGLTVAAKDMPHVAEALIDLRDTIRTRLHGDGLVNTVLPFDRTAYNKSLPLLQNIVFAVERRPVTQTEVAEHPGFLKLMRDLDLVKDIADVAQAVVELLHNAFGADSTDHPLFQRLRIEAKAFEETLRISDRAKADGFKALTDKELALLLALPCVLSPDHTGQFVPKPLQARIVGLRETRGDFIREATPDLFQSIDPKDYLDGLTLLENAVFGAINKTTGPRTDMMTNTVAAVLMENGLTTPVANLTLDEATLLGGSNLPPRVAERIAFARAAIKKPDILVLNRALISYDKSAKASAIAHLRETLPDATIILIEESFEPTDTHDVFVELHAGRITRGAPETPEIDEAQASEPDLAGKLHALEQTVFFAGLERRQLRLLAFSAQYFEIPAGQVVFDRGDDPSDGVYLVQTGEADFVDPFAEGGEKLLRTAGPGSLVGELGLILGEPRTLTMRARSDITGLRIGSEEFLTILQADAKTTFKLMQLIAGYLSYKGD